MNEIVQIPAAYVSNTTVYLDAPIGPSGGLFYGEFGVQFELSDDELLFLVEKGNAPSFVRAQFVCSVNLSGLDRARAEIVKLEGNLEAGCDLFVMLCDERNMIIRKPKLPLDVEQARLDLPIDPNVVRACFVLRFYGKGTFQSVQVRIVGERGTSDHPQTSISEFVLRPLPKSIKSDWLADVPANVYPALTADLIAAQQVSIGWLRWKLAQRNRRGPRIVRGIRDLFAGAAWVVKYGITRFRNLIRRKRGSTSVPWKPPAIIDDSDGDTAFGIDISPRHIAIARGAVARFRQSGLSEALRHVMVQSLDLTTQSKTLLELANNLNELDRAAALRAYWVAYGSNPTPARAQKISLLMFKHGNVSSAHRLWQFASTEAPSSAFSDELRLAATLLINGPPIPARQTEKKPTPGGRIAYVASSAQPYSVSGYTIRTHQLLRAMKIAGLDVHGYLRPGYPWDRRDATHPDPAFSNRQTIDDVEYLYTPGIPAAGSDKNLIQRTSDALEDRFRALPPSLVHAASNHRNALPALIAARRIGVPFIYEIRGLWELTAASKITGWEETERFNLERSLELRIASEADRVFVITQGLANELIDAGIDGNKIHVLPNAVDPLDFKPTAKDPALVSQYGLDGVDLTLVYAGSVTHYEGLDDLIMAVGILRKRGIRTKFILVGDGYYRTNLEQLTAEQGLQDSVSFVGRVKPSQVNRYWSLADVVSLPRKPYKVCNIVSPLKPFEAMAMGKPIVLTDLPVLHEIVTHEKTGLICKPADPEDLANALGRLAQSPELRASLGAAGREWVLQNRTWSTNIKRLTDVYASIGVM